MSKKNELVIRRGILSLPSGVDGPISVNKRGVVSSSVKSSNIVKGNNVIKINK